MSGGEADIHVLHVDDEPDLADVTATFLDRHIEDVAVETATQAVSGGTRDRNSGSVHIRVGRTDEGFFVADDGPGIPAAEREAVFQHGYSTRDGGTGYGLSIVRRIATAHGWDVSITESERGGARFAFAT